MSLQKTIRITILILLLLVAACTPRGPEPEVAGENPDIIEATPDVPTPQPLPDATDEDAPASDDEIKPPPATLTVAGASQESGIGTYCWSGNGAGICVDMIGIPTAQEPLPAETLALLEFDLPLDEIPANISLTVTPVSAADALPDTPGGYRWWSYAEGADFTLPLVADPLIEVTLQPGLNVLNLFVIWPGYGDVSYGFLLDVAGDVGEVGSEPGTEPAGAHFWSLAEDPRTGIRFAVPCYWQVRLPELDPSGLGAFPVRNYSDAFVEQFPRGAGVFENGGIKIDFVYLEHAQFNLADDAPLAELATRLGGKNGVLEGVVPVASNGQEGALVTIYEPQFDSRAYTFLFPVGPGLTLALGFAPPAAVDHPDVRGIVNSLALSSDVAVQVPDIVPAGPPSGEGPFECMRMGSDGPPEPLADSLPCPATPGSPQALACAIQAALWARDMGAVAELMVDPFRVGYWQSEGIEQSAAAMAAELDQAYLPADSSDLTFTTDRAQFPDLYGMPPEAMFGPDLDSALIVYSRGWSMDGNGAALIYIVYDETGQPVWHSLVLAGAGFE